MDWISITHHLTKRRIFCTLESNIIKVAKPDFLKLPIDVHLPILTDLDLYQELKIIEAELAELNNETYSTELSDPEEEYERRKAKEFSSNNNCNWWEDYSGPETD